MLHVNTPKSLFLDALVPSQLTIEYSTRKGLDVRLTLTGRQLFQLGEPDDVALDSLAHELVDAVRMKWCADLDIEREGERFRKVFVATALGTSSSFAYGDGVATWSLRPAAAQYLRSLFHSGSWSAAAPGVKPRLLIPPFRAEDLSFPVMRHKLRFDWKGREARLEIIFEKDHECWYEMCHVYLDAEMFDEYGEGRDDGWDDAVRDCFGTVQYFMTGDNRHETPITEELAILIEARLESLLAQENAHV